MSRSTTLPSASKLFAQQPQFADEVVDFAGRVCRHPAQQIAQIAGRGFAVAIGLARQRCRAAPAREFFPRSSASADLSPPTEPRCLTMVMTSSPLFSCARCPATIRRRMTPKMDDNVTASRLADGAIAPAGDYCAARVASMPDLIRQSMRHCSEPATSYTDHRIKPGGDESRSVHQRRNPADVVEVAERNGV